jgi:hypothetical protein
MSTAGDELRSRVAPLLEVLSWGPTLDISLFYWAPRKDRHRKTDAYRARCREYMRRRRAADPEFCRANREYENRPEVRVKRKVARILREIAREQRPAT